MDIKSIFTTIPGKYVLVLPDPPVFTIVAVTDDYLHATDRKREDLLQKGLFEIFPNNPGDPNRTSEKTVRASLEYALIHKESHHLPVQRYDLLNSKGLYEERYWSANNKPLLNDEGEVVYLIHSATDVTEKLKAEEQEKAMKGIERAYNLFMNSPVNIAILKGKDDIIELANEGMLRVWDSKAIDATGKPLKEVVAELEPQGFFELLEQVKETGVPLCKKEVPVISYKRQKEETSFFDFSFQPYSDNGLDASGSGVIVVANDVTEQVLARKKVEEINKEVQFVLNVMPQMVWSTDPQGNGDFFNQIYLDYTGLPLDKLTGYQWTALLHEDDLQSSADLWQQSLDGSNDGYSVEHRLRGKDGIYRWFLTRGVPLKDASGKIIKWYGTTTDIEEQKTAAVVLEQRVQERTRELQIRNSELEQFTYVTSHDLQEPLRKINVFADILRLQGYENLNTTSRKYVDKITESTQRMRLALADVLNFIILNKQEQFVPVDLNEVIRDVQTDLELIINEKKALFFIDELLTIKGIPHQVNKLLFNLINNALKYSKAEEPPRIAITGKKLDNEELGSHKDLDHKKQYYCISVRDNGIGFKADYTEKIFRMFQRLHNQDVYAGTGIGLALCKKVVVNHGGKIWAESKPGEGACFFVLLPID